MNHEEPAEDGLTFGEKLLGMQGFSASRAKRYREELERLLVHRLNRSERWMAGVEGVVIAITLVVGGAAMALVKPRREHAGLDEARLTVAITCLITGVTLGGWFLRIAVQGGYGRRLGDFMGVFIASLFCGGWGIASINMAWYTADQSLRLKLLLAGGALFGLMFGCVVVAYSQHMHRQTEEKLLRIEYHLAELMERLPDPRSATP